MNLARRYHQRLRWEIDYETAFKMRDWQTCDRLHDEKPPPLPRLLELFVNLATGRFIA